MPTLPAVVNAPVVVPTAAIAAPNAAPTLTTQILIAFLVGPRPPGTPGKDPFFMREVLGLNGPDYILVLNTIREIARACRLDFFKSMKKQNVNVVRRISEVCVDVFPRLNDFSHLSNPYWVPEAFLQVILKSAADARRYNANSRAAASIAPPESPREAKKRRAARQASAKKAALARSASRRAAAAHATATAPEPANEDDSIEAMLREFSIHEKNNDDDEEMPVAGPLFPVGASPTVGHAPAPAPVYAPPPAPGHLYSGSANVPQVPLLRFSV